MKKIFITISIVLVTVPASADKLVSLEKALQRNFGKKAEIQTDIIELTAEQATGIEEQADITFGETHRPFVRRHRVTAGSRGPVVAYEDIVVGKWGPIHYLVMVGPSGKIDNVTILAYMEIRGKPIKKKRFLKQYFGKSLDDPIQLKRDIDGVSGATISSRSLTDGIRKILHIHRVVG